jgi:hypothetical protein
VGTPRRPPWQDLTPQRRPSPKVRESQVIGIRSRQASGNGAYTGRPPKPVSTRSSVSQSTPGERRRSHAHVSGPSMSRAHPVAGPWRSASLSVRRQVNGCPSGTRGAFRCRGGRHGPPPDPPVGGPTTRVAVPGHRRRPGGTRPTATQPPDGQSTTPCRSGQRWRGRATGPQSRA